MLYRSSLCLARRAQAGFPSINDKRFAVVVSGGGGAGVIVVAAVVVVAYVACC